MHVWCAGRVLGCNRHHDEVVLEADIGSQVLIGSVKRYECTAVVDISVYFALYYFLQRYGHQF